MPDQLQDVSEEERKGLIAKMKASRAFRGTEDLPKLLDFLLESCRDMLSAGDIEERHYKRDRAGQYFAPNHARERVSKLKERITRYESENPDELIKAELPNADDIGGYQLRFRRVSETASACRRFWAAHLESEKQVSVVCDPLLVFWDTEKNMMFRFMDTNIEGINRKRALDELKRLHEGEYREGLVPGHLYIDIGTVMGAERIRNFFRASGSEVALDLDKQRNTDWLKASPIVIGNIRTNLALSELFDARETKGLAYRLDADRYAWMNIRKPEKPEIETLAQIGITLEAEGSFTRPSLEMTFGVVSRMPNSHGGVMTFVCSDSTFTTAQMLVALTDETQLRELFNRMGWRIDRPVPETFEMMFFVRLFPYGTHDQGDKAELICWRPHSR